MLPFKIILYGTASILATCGISQSALIVNAPMPITHVVQVQPIVAQQTPGSGGASATFFGTAAQQAIIEAHIDTIWSQVGVDIQWLTATTYINDFAYEGTSGSNNPRPTSDLSTINTSAGAPPKSTVPAVLNMFFVDIVPGFSFTTENTANGLAFVDGNGVTQFVGDNLLTFEAGREVIASVVAHEIGHNLGLPHLVQAENLMQAGGSPNPGERLTAADRITILTDNGGNDGFELLQAVPEPSSALLAGLGFLLLGRRRR